MRPREDEMMASSRPGTDGAGVTMSSIRQHDHEGRLVIELPHLFDELDAVDLRHHPIRDDGVEGLPLDLLERFGAVVDGHYVIARLADLALQDQQRSALIVGY